MNSDYTRRARIGSRRWVCFLGLTVALLPGSAQAAADGDHCCIREPLPLASVAKGPVHNTEEWQHTLQDPDWPFVIHWNSTGDSASTEGTALAVLEGLLAAARTYHDSLGYSRPPLFDGATLPVFLRPQNAMGITQPQETPDPGYACTLYLDRGFARWGADSLGLARLTAAHEYFHAVQFGYGFVVQNLAFYEASAVWAEDRVYPEQDDWVTRYGPAFLADLTLPLDTFSGVRHYGAAMALKVLQAHDEGDDDLRLTVAAAGSHIAWPFLLSLRTNPNDAYAALLAELCHAGSRAFLGGGTPSFPELALLPPVDLPLLPALPDGSGLAPLGAALYRPARPAAVTSTVVPVYHLSWPGWTPAHIPDARCLPLAAVDLVIQPNPAPRSEPSPLMLEYCTTPAPSLEALFISDHPSGPALRLSLGPDPRPLALYSLTGACLWRSPAPFPPGTHTLPLPGLASGVYILAALPDGPATSVVVVK